MSEQEGTNWTTSTRRSVSEELMQERLTTMAIFACFGVFGTVLNFTALMLTCCTGLRRNPVNVLLSNLSFADWMLTAGFTFGNSFYVLYREWLPPIGCQYLGFIIAMAGVQEYASPPLLALNRYLSLYKEKTYEKIFNRTGTALLIGGSWLFCASLPLLFTLAGQTGFDEDNEHCCVIVVGDRIWTYVYWGVVIAPLVLLFNSSMLYCNWRIYVKLREHTKTKLLKMNVIRQNREILYFLLIDMSLPIMFHSVYQILKFVFVQRQSVHVRRFFALLYLINACIRAVLTLLFLRPYRKQLIRMMARFCCCMDISDLTSATVNSASRAPGVTRTHANLITVKDQ